MPDPLRRGSILLFCLAVVSLLAVLAYGFVRVAQLHRQSGDSSNLHLLAREASVTGLNHAMEQIVRDYVNEPVTRLDGPAIRAFTTHDIPYALSNSSALEISGTTGGATAVNRDDMPPTDAFDRLMLTYWNASTGSYQISEGHMASPGRGRFYEPEFYNLAPTAQSAFDPTITAPTVPVRFGDPYPTSTAAPGRSAGIFYDDAFRRISGDPRTARTEARYRLRYAVVISDLEGQILVSGDQGVDYRLVTTADPRGIADPALARIVRNMHRLPAIVDAYEVFGKGVSNNRFMAANESAGLAAEHVFIGRGAANNVDRPRGAGSAPTTFPLMYRKQDAPAKFSPFGNLYQGSPDGSWPGPDLYSTSSASVQGLVGGGEEIPTTNSNPFVHMLIGPQHSFFNWLHATYGDASEGVDSRGMACFDRYTPFGRGVSQRDTAAGESATRYRANVDTPWCVNLLTVTPRVFYGMVAGYMPPGAIPLRYSARADAPANWVMAGEAPAGASTITVTGGTGSFKHGDKLTLETDGTIYTVVSATPIGPNVTLALSPKLAMEHLYLSLPPLEPAHRVTVSWSGFYAATRTRDLFVRELSQAFDRYAGPQRVANGTNPAIIPDFHVDDFWNVSGATNTIYRGPVDRYPGILAFNGFDPNVVHTPGNASDMEKAWLHDSLGIYLRSKAVGAPNLDATDRIIAASPRSEGAIEPSTHAAGRFWLSAGAGTDINRLNRISVNLVTGAINGLAIHQSDTMTPTTAGDKPSLTSAHPESIWETIGQAMAGTASVVQGQQFLYPTCKSGTTLERNPATWFDGAAWAGPRVTSIREADALFVNNLGSSFSQPNDPNPTKVWYGKTDGRGVLSFTPDWNLASLRVAKASGGAPHDLYALNDPSEPGYDGAKPTYSATARTQIAELIINDARLSFFGSSPEYGDAFRALDLNGDGKVACSGFASVGAGTYAVGMTTATEQQLGIDCYTTNVDANGVATVPVEYYFSNTGTFILPKSRFWHVIVRGEVWDNVARTTIDRAQLDAVVCVDPVGAANEFGSAGTQDPAGGQYSTHVIYQSWVLDSLRDFLPRRY